jgi:hypothetical protein
MKNLYSDRVLSFLSVSRATKLDALTLPEEKRYSLAQLIDFAERKFGKCLEDLLDINERSWKRRELWQEQHQRQEENVEDAVCSMHE